MFVKSTATAYYGYDEFGFGLYDPRGAGIPIQH